MKTTISKSKYLNGLQCPKMLWHYYNAPDAFPPIDDATQAIFDAGHLVGDLAKLLYPDGVEVPMSRDLQETVTGTQALLPQRKPIFEASFREDGCYCRADLLVPAADDRWDLYEVKSSTQVKPVNIADVAFQTQVLEAAGLKLNRLYLTHIDNTYLRQGKIDPAGLFHSEDITDQARALQPLVMATVARFREVITGAMPEIGIGRHCHEPYSCDLWDQCSGFLPEYPVTQLYRARTSKKFELIDRGVTALADVPADELSDAQLVQQQVVASGQTHVDSQPIRDWLDGLEYPLYCFDFETMNPAVPLFDGTRPFQQIPFQFSLHIIEAENAVPRHVEFLAEPAADPRPALVEALQALEPVVQKGTVLAYNMGFEKRILRELAQAFPDHAGFFTHLIERFADLITPFSKFWYYDAAQQGSCSLKYVLPALTGKTYEGMAISDGGEAMRKYQRVVHGKASQDEKRRVLADLLIYCGQDTLALIDIIRDLRKLVGTA